MADIDPLTGTLFLPSCTGRLAACDVVGDDPFRGVREAPTFRRGALNNRGYALYFSGLGGNNHIHGGKTYLDRGC